MRQLDGIIDSTDMSLSKLREIVKDKPEISYPCDDMGFLYPDRYQQR